MSVNVSRRDALKGMMAAGAAVAAMPYLASLAGTAQASTAPSVPVQAAKAASATTATTSASPSIITSLNADVEPIVLVIRNDMVRGYKGLQEIKVQDSGLAFNLKSAMAGRFK